MNVIVMIDDNLFDFYKNAWGVHWVVRKDNVIHGKLTFEVIKPNRLKFREDSSFHEVNLDENPLGILVFSIEGKRIYNIPLDLRQMKATERGDFVLFIYNLGTKNNKKYKKSYPKADFIYFLQNGHMTTLFMEGYFE
jgi:hypothetical protein